jgi:hypothetical protein
MASGEPLTRASVSSHGEPALRRRADVHPHLHEALGLLLQAHDYAVDLGQDFWDLAVELAVLRAARLTNSDLRWLAAKGYVDHGIETTTAEDCSRRFRHAPLLTLTDATCFVLTQSGVSVARDINTADDINAAAKPEVSICNIVAPEEILGRPRWDHQRRQLCIGAQLVKEFKLPSPNQETVLMAFEEEAWPPRIDDPLPPVAHLDPRRRLHDTIKALNRKQKRYLIRFRGDGSGEGIRWEPALPR